MPETITTFSFLVFFENMPMAQVEPSSRFAADDLIEFAPQPILFGTRVLYRANESMEFFSGIDGVLAREQLVLKRVDRAFRSANLIVR